MAKRSLPPPNPAEWAAVYVAIGVRVLGFITQPIVVALLTWRRYA